MAYIGKSPVIGNFVKLDSITVVNGQAAYTMQNGGSNFTDYESVNQFLVSLNGTIQAPTDSFTVSGSTLTFASNLSTGDVIDFIMVFGNSLSAGTPTDATVSTAKIVDANVTTAKLADDSVTAAKINNDIISGSTELATAPADTDEFLVSDAGTLKRIDYSLIKGGGAFEKISTTTISSAVASVDFDTLSTDYRDFRIVISSLVTDVHQDVVNLRVKRSGQSSYDSGGGDYRFSNLGNISHDGSTISTSSNGQGRLRLHISNLARDAASGGVDGSTFNAVIDCVDVHGTTNSKFFHYRAGFIEGVYGASANTIGAGYRYDTSETALIGLQILCLTAQLVGGTITLYGRKN